MLRPVRASMILQSISGEPAFGTDLVSLDEGRDALVIWHCGLAPLSMADPGGQPGVTVHSNRQKPLLFEFTLKPGVVTVARLSEASGGVGLGTADAVIVFEELGKRVVPGPLIWTHLAADLVDGSRVNEES